LFAALAELLALTKTLRPTRLSGHAPGSIGLAAIAAQACGHFGDRLVGVEHHQGHHAALDRHGDHSALGRKPLRAGAGRQAFGRRRA
jgi:hypothetical protein